MAEQPQIRFVRGPGRSLDLLPMRDCLIWEVNDLYVFAGIHEGNQTLTDARIYRREPGRWFLDVRDLCFNIHPVELLWKLESEVCEPPDELIQDVQLELDGSLPLRPVREDAPIVLGEDHRYPVIVVNKKLDPVSKERFGVLKVIIDAYPGGLPQDDFKVRSGYEGAIGMFKKLAERPYYNDVLVCPGVVGNGSYRCKWPGL